MLRLVQTPTPAPQFPPIIVLVDPLGTPKQLQLRIRQRVRYAKHPKRGTHRANQHALCFAAADDEAHVRGVGPGADVGAHRQVDQG